jgi:prepilin-type N-terminal cleavage/methylation domain-containing protein
MEKLKLIRRKKGFTLVEVIIAMGVLGLVMTLTAGVLVSVVKSYQKQKVISEVERNGDFVIRILEERIRNASSVRCVGVELESGEVTSIDTSVACDESSEDVFLEIISHNRADPASYIGIATSSGPTEGRTETCASLSARNKFLFLTEDITLLKPDGTITDEDRITNADLNTGVCIDDIDFTIVDTSTPVQVTVDLSILDSVGTDWDVENKFSSFVTVRGSYK